MSVRLAVLAFVAAVTTSLGARAEVGPGPPAFTPAQAEAGRIAYAGACASCHGAALDGGAGPALAGGAFQAKWSGRPAADLAGEIKNTMPLGAPASLTDAQYAEITAFVLSRNAAGPAPAAPSAPPVLLQAPANPGKATSDRPDDAELKSPGPGVWGMYNGTYDGGRFSPLSQINVANAARLQPVCIYQTGETGRFQSSAVVYGGLLYITTAYTTFALDAVTCEKRWSHTYPDQQATTVSTSRGVAIYRGKLFRITPNGHLLALDARTGALLWDVLMADIGVGYWVSAAPIAYDGRVFIGQAGADWGANGHLFAFDAETGRHLWTFNAIPTGREPGAETWGRGAEHGGGSFWSTFALDTAQGLIYAPIGNPAPDFDGAMRPGANLYTNSVVALDYRTGKLAWYAQQTPHDTHDWDTAAAPTLYSQDGRDYMVAGDKGGYVYLYDRKTHKLIAKTEVSPHENVDAPITPQGTHHCPGIIGGVQWNGAAYAPPQRLFYVNSVHWCGTTALTESRYVAGSSYTGARHTWDPVVQAKGFTRALDAATGKVVWTRESKTPMVAALTPTAGGVVFTGDLDGWFLALDAKSGETLYRFNTGGAVAGAASTYQIDGRQYVALTTGNASQTVWKTTGAGTVVVFALPKP